MAEAVQGGDRHRPHLGKALSRGLHLADGVVDGEQVVQAGGEGAPVLHLRCALGEAAHEARHVADLPERGGDGGAEVVGVGPGEEVDAVVARLQHRPLARRPLQPTAQHLRPHPSHRPVHQRAHAQPLLPPPPTGVALLAEDAQPAHGGGVDAHPLRRDALDALQLPPPIPSPPQLAHCVGEEAADGRHQQRVAHVNPPPDPPPTALTPPHTPRHPQQPLPLTRNPPPLPHRPHPPPPLHPPLTSPLPLQCHAPRRVGLVGSEDEGGVEGAQEVGEDGGGGEGGAVEGAGRGGEVGDGGGGVGGTGETGEEEGRGGWGGGGGGGGGDGAGSVGASHGGWTREEDGDVEGAAERRVSEM